MKRFSFVFQIFFKLLLIFLLVFVWVRYFIRSLLYSIIISAFITAIIDILTRLLFNKNKQKQDLKFKEKLEAENIFLSFAIDGNYISFYEKLFSEQLAEKKKKYILLQNSTAIYPFFSFDTLKISDIVSIMKKVKKEKITKLIIPCGDFSKDCSSFIKIFDEEVILLDKYQTYQTIYKNKKTFPEITRKVKETKSLTIKKIIELSFNKQRTKGYLLSALALMFCTLFVKTTLYYVITISLLIIFALFSYTNPYFNKKDAKEII